MSGPESDIQFGNTSVIKTEGKRFLLSRSTYDYEADGTLRNRTLQDDRGNPIGDEYLAEGKVIKRWTRAEGLRGPFEILPQ